MNVAGHKIRPGCWTRPKLKRNGPGSEWEYAPDEATEAAEAVETVEPPRVCVGTVGVGGLDVEERGGSKEEDVSSPSCRSVFVLDAVAIVRELLAAVIVLLLVACESVPFTLFCLDKVGGAAHSSGATHVDAPRPNGGFAGLP
ncbi:hypothetical protein B0H12DRAFT_1154015 [Mycena haematopus]|nr:hypothetical protein B0H12DRAFT_1154015 [Mycena haematopus]